MSLISGPRIVTDSLAFYIDAKNTKSYPGSGTTWYDLTNNRYNGLLSNVTYDSDGGGSMQFSSGYCNLGTSTSLLYPGTSDFTWNGWLNFGGFTGTERMLWCGNANGGARGFGINLRNSSNNFGIEIYGTSGGRQQKTVTTTAYLNVWHYWSFVIKQSTFTIDVYTDGIFNQTLVYADWGSINQHGVNKLIIGNYLDLTLYPYDGKMANISVYRKELTATEVLQNYKALRTRFI